MRESTL